MKFEKLNDNKIRITLNHQDLVDKDIDFHSFMSNSIESQDLFIDMLAEAEKKIGFITKDYKIRIEALAVADGDFIITVTRMSPNIANDKLSKKKVQIRRKKLTHISNHAVYRFETFDDFCNFSNCLNNLSFQKLHLIAKNILLYSYKNNYYLTFSQINTNHKYIKNFYSCITEFATHVYSPDLFISKLMESGNIIMKHNALKSCMHFFSYKSQVEDNS